MVQIKKGLFTLLVGLFGLLSVNAQNLFKNGDFKNGREGWYLSGFEPGKEGEYTLVQTGYYSEFFGPSIKTDGQVIEGLSGNTYTFSFWAKGFTADNLTVNIKLKDKDDKELYDSQIGIKRNFKLDMVEDNGSWKKFAKTVTFPSNVAKLYEFRISFSGGNYNYKAVSEISMIEKVSAPQNFKVAEGTLGQRGVQLTWDAVEGKEYKVKVGEMEYSAAKGSLVLQGLTPNTNYKAEVYTTDAQDKKTALDFKTEDFIGKEGERVPFLANVKENKVDAKFMYDISDLEGDAIEKVEVTFNGLPATMENGYVMLPDSASGELMVKVTQKGGEVTTLTYKSITKK